MSEHLGKMIKTTTQGQDKAILSSVMRTSKWRELFLTL